MGKLTERRNYFLLVGFQMLTLGIPIFVEAQSFGHGPYSSSSHRVTLDPEVDYTLEWDMDSSSKSMVFNISANTNGYLALGLSKRGQLDGADVVICGVGQDGRPYIADMTCMNNNILSRDSVQDWRILSSQRSGGRTMMTIARDLDTCDNQDISLNDGLIHAIWGYGNENSIQTRFEPKGNLPIYFQDPVIPRSSVREALQPWRVSRSFRVPTRHTSYWCSIVRGPQIRTKQHIVEFRPYFANEISRRHVHHQLLYRCSVPPGANASMILEQFVNHPGEECYLNDNPILPSAFCREMMHMWAVGGQGAELPPDVGFPVEPNEYYMLETHYNNPEVRSDLLIESGVDFQLTPQLRENDGGMMFVGFGVIGTFAIPPQSSSFNIIGHCSPQCTRDIATSSGIAGIEIIGATLHAHTSARRMRLKQYRGSRELPWVMNDDNYDFNVQQARFFETPVSVLPGDQLVTQCGFDNTWRNDSVVSGFSTRDEMCTAFLYLKRRVPYLYCTSEFPTQLTMERFAIRNMTWDVIRHERVVTSAVNPNFVGLGFSEVVDRTNWTPARRAEIEREQMFETHQGSCFNVQALSSLAYQAILAQGQGSRDIASLRPNLQTFSTSQPSGTVQFPPGASEYRPQSVCAENNQGISITATQPPISTGLGTLGWSDKTLSGSFPSVPTFVRNNFDRERRFSFSSFSSTRGDQNRGWKG